jgi:murein L,D-transpeptidase YafK
MLNPQARKIRFVGIKSSAVTKLFAAAALLIAMPSLFALPQSQVDVVDHVVVYKHDRRLILVSHGKPVCSYRVALGGDPVGPKTRQGDHKTPEGRYVLDSRNPNSRFYKAFHVSYPNAMDLAVARKAGLDPGGDIMLHGLPKNYAWLGKTHTLHDWTEGCIAVTNQEMDEIWHMVRVGTPIDIKP